MAIKVTIPTALRRFANGQATVEVHGKTISEVLGNLMQRFWLETQGHERTNLESFQLEEATAP